MVNSVIPRYYILVYFYSIKRLPIPILFFVHKISCFNSSPSYIFIPHTSTTPNSLTA